MTIIRQGSKVASFITERGQEYSLNWTPEGANLSGLAWEFAQVPVQGRKALVRRAGPSLRVLSFSHDVIGSPPGGENAILTTNAVKALVDLAESGLKVRLINVSSDLETRGWYYVTDLTVAITARAVNQEILNASLSWTLTEANDARPAIARTPPPPPPPKPAPAMQADYKVVAGDSLWKIAAAKLGNGARWKEIYDLNKTRLNLKPPEMYGGLLTVWIYPGQVMKIPPR